MTTERADGAQRTPFVRNFQDRITLIECDGKPVVVAREFGAMLDYADNGNGLVVLITGRWADEFIPDVDMILLKNGRLAEFKKMCAALGLNLVDKRAPSLLLLTQSGIQLVLSRSEKPEGKTFRRWLVSEAIPGYEAARRGEPLPGAHAPRVEGPVADTTPPKARGGRGSRLGGGRPRPLLTRARGLADLKYNYLIDWQMNAVDRYDTEGHQQTFLEVRDHLMYRTLRLLNNCDVESWRAEVWKGVASAVGMTLATFEGDPLLEEARAKGWLVEAQAKDLLSRMDDFQLVRALSLVAQQMGVAKVVSGFSLQLSGWRWSPGPDPAEELTRLRKELERAKGELERIQPLKRRSSG